MSTILARVIGGGSSAGTATARDVLAGKTFSNDDDVEIVGTATAVPATEYHVTTEDQTIITSDSHTTGNQTLKGVTSENISASNIRSGTIVKVNNGKSDIINVTGNYTSSLSSGQTAMTAAQLLTGYSGFVNGGGETKGSMANKAGTTQTATVDRSGTDIRMKIPANGYYNTSSYLKAAGSTFGDAAAGHVLSGKYFTSSNGLKIQGSITSQAAKTVYATTSDQTAVASGKYCSGAITVKKLTQTNLAAANILRGKTISINNGSTNVWSVAGNSAVLKMVSGNVTQPHQTLKLPLNGGGTRIVYYNNVAPGITPTHIFCYSNNSTCFHMILGAYSYGVVAGAQYTFAASAQNSFNHSASSCAVFGYNTDSIASNNYIYYIIFGY